ncbi:MULTISPECIES: hypothetical protein [unclassified Caballeronia]|uniref:hypothetical protein n=1 Tax=unclassified Caballeronia TaxID=2646786 RepID=UPI002028B784|nr:MULTISPECIES: hypothetical protein [unclassified Caballeronia]
MAVRLSLSMYLTIKQGMERPHLDTSDAIGAAIVPRKVAMRKGLAHRSKWNARHSAT